MKVSLLSYKHPEIKGPRTGVFAKIPHHLDSYEKRYFETTYKAHYEEKYKDFIPKTICDFKNENAFCGKVSIAKPIDRIRITTELIGEKYKDFIEPKENTAIQRSWEYKSDAAINHVTNKVEILNKEDKMKDSCFNIITNEILKSKPVSKAMLGLTENSNLLRYRTSDINKSILKTYNLRGE